MCFNDNPVCCGSCAPCPHMVGGGQVMMLQPSLPGTRETMAGAITAVVVEEARAAAVPGSGYLVLIFQNVLHALESQVVCNASFAMFCFKGVKADGPPTTCITSALLEKKC